MYVLGVLLSVNFPSYTRIRDALPRNGIFLAFVLNAERTGNCNLFEILVVYYY